MYAIATFLIVAVITMAFTQLATGALIATSMPAKIASFQARSAFSGAGFTTTEAENVVNHPVRRRIITTTMLVGTLGTPTLVVTIVIGFVAPGPGSPLERSLVAVAGIVAVVMLAVNRPMTRYLEAFGRHYAQRRLLPAMEGTPQELLALGDDYAVVVARLIEDVEDSQRSLRGIEHALPRVRVLGVRTDGAFVGEAPADLTLKADDELVLYGRRERLAELGLLDGQ